MQRRRAPSVTLPPSTERYAIEARVGVGGMGEVYRAQDRTTGERVAIKLLRSGATPDLEARFRREVNILADLRHPNIVQYIDHGVWSDGRRFLAMEWLEGEDLLARTKRQPLGMSDAVEAVRRASAALAAVHARGVVHRDIKLSNLWLSDGKIQRVKLIDFGVVKPPEDDGFTTQPGAIVGTPHHMAPEQARNEPVTPRSDVYALGSVLFLLVTGRVVFPTEHLVALLGRLVLEDPPRASSVRHGVPEPLDLLIERCLQREPEERFADGGELSRALARVGPVPSEPPATSRTSSRLSTSSRRLAAAAAGVSGRRVVAVVLAWLDQGLLPKELSRALRAMLRERDHLEPIRGERLVVVLGVGGSLGDEALRAARAALWVARLAAGARVAVAAGHVNEAEQGLSTATLERAAALLEQTSPGEVRVDAETVPLLGTRFRLREGGVGAALLGEEESLGRTRQLLGRPTPTVGRDREFAALATMYLDALAEQRSRAALVVGPAGVGKSRLRYEIVRWLRAQPQPPEVLLCRGDPLSERGGLGALGRALRTRLGIQDGEDPAQQQARLGLFADGLRMQGLLDSQTEPFLGELVGVRGGGERSEALRAAQQNPALMLAQLQRVYEAVVLADASRAPQVVIVEDLHWADDLTRALVGWVLASARLPYVVFAFARPGDERSLDWPEVLSMELAPLQPADAAKLVSEALPGVDGAVRDAIVERAGGNALFLEELIRHAAEGRDGLPLTVQALVQARLDAMEPALRAVARAASVFGRACWSGGVEALVGEDPDEALEALSSHEIVTENEEGRFAGQREWVFRHALVREAIYASLLESDRARFHGQAARWLEVAGEEDLATLAWHVEQSGDLVRAGDLYARATAQAQAAGHLDSVLALAESGLACARDPGLRGQFLAAKGRAASWLGRYSEALSHAQRALDEGVEGSAPWAEAARVMASALRDLGRQRESARVLAEALTEQRSLGYDEATRSSLLAEQARTLADLGRLPEARDAADRALLLAERARVGRESAQLRAVDARFFVTAVEGRLAKQIEACLDVLRLADVAGDVPLATRARCNLGHCLNCLGCFDEAHEALERALADARRSRILPLQGFALHNLGLTLARTGRLDEASGAQQQARTLAEQMGHERLRTSSLQYEALALAWRRGDLGRQQSLNRALELAREAHRAAAQQPTQRVMATRVLGYVQQRRGANEAALELLGEPGVVPSGLGDHEWGELARLAQIEALLALGERDDALAALRQAVEALQHQARALAPEHQRSYLEGIDENRRLLELARSLLGG